MSGKQDVTYTVDFRVGQPSIQQVPTSDAISRIARLMALAIRFEGLVNDGTVRDYADLARRGHVTRARMTQIMKLLHLAPDNSGTAPLLASHRGPQREKSATDRTPDRLG
jgi:hypothetical protein